MNGRTDARKWALLGAETRIRELTAEMAEIYRLFPELKRRRANSGAGGGAKRRTSAAGRRAVSEGMRKYWARRKAKEARAGRAAKA